MCRQTRPNGCPGGRDRRAKGTALLWRLISRFKISIGKNTVTISVPGERAEMKEQTTITTGEKGAAMNQKTETSSRSTERGAVVAGVLFAIAALAAAVLVGAMTGPKYPDNGGD